MSIENKIPDSFHEFVRDFKAGHLDSTLQKELVDLTSAVVTHGKKGKLTIAIELNPKADGEVHTSVKFEAKAPKRNVIEAIQFATPESRLINSNPKQPDMFTGPVREASAKPQVVKSM